MLKSKFAFLRYIFVATMLTVFAASAIAYSTDYYTQSSRLSEGKWVKVRVKDNGIYQFSYDQLREMGFSDPSKVAVYGYGGCRLTENTFSTSLGDDLKQTASHHTADGRLLFYGEGDFSYKIESAPSITLLRNVYDLYGYYYLSDSEAPAEVATVEWTRHNNTLSSHYVLDIIENEEQNPGQGGSIFHDKILNPGDSETFDFDIHDYKTGSNGFIIVKAAASSSAYTEFSIDYSGNISTLNQINLSISPVSSTSKIYRSQTASSIFTSSKSDFDLSITLTHSASSKATYAATDYIGIIYPRQSRLGENSSLLMQFEDASTNKNFSISEADDNVLVWNIDDIESIYGYQTHYSAENQTVECSFDKNYSSSTGACRIIAFNPAATFATPTVIGDITNQNIHGDEVPDMVIITTQALYDKAEELAEIHRSTQGLTVHVYTQQQIFNEFSSGCRAAMAYRRMAKMFYDRNPEKFKYLLLYGASYWDNRALTLPDRDLLVCYEAELENLANDSNTNFVSDNYFGMLEDTYYPNSIQQQNINIAVGRIATENEQRAGNYNKKVLDYITNPPSPKATATAVYSSDDGNNLSHLIQAEDAISQMYDNNSAMTFVKAHNTLYPWQSGDAKIARALIVAGLKSGAGYFSYSGHGNSTCITGENLWSNSAINTTNYSVPPFVMLASCHTFAFDRLDNGMGEVYLGKNNGGAIAVVAACRYVYLEYNQRINLAIANAYAGIDENSTIGSIYLNAHKSLLSSAIENGALINALCYNLGGDPAVPVIGAKYRVKVTEINGEQVNDADSATVKVSAHNAIKISGYVAPKGDDAVCADFSGNVLINIYDVPRTLTTLLRSSGDGSTPMDIDLNSDLLAMTTATVSEGKFTATVYLPTPANLDMLNRMTLFATSDTDSAIYGKGECNAMTVAQDSESELTTSAPQILDVYLDNTTVSDNGSIGSSFTYHAAVNPSEVGLNLSEATIGSSTKLMLDNGKSIADIGGYLTLADDGTAQITVPFNSISLGHHTLTLSVANTFGQRAERSIEFNVEKPSAVATLTVDAPVARTAATLNLSHTFTSTPTCHLIIQTDDGKTVVRQDNCSFPYEWHLQDLSGSDVSDGRYRAYVLLSDDSNTAATPAVDIVVIR